MKIVYQTLEDRFTDLDKLEREGPYICSWENSWLGDGYYFWEAFIENAHWWGREIRKYANGYMSRPKIGLQKKGTKWRKNVNPN